MHGDGGEELVTGMKYPRQNGAACEWSTVNCCARVMTALEAHLGSMLQTTVTGFAMDIVLFVVTERASWDTPKFFKMLKDNSLYDEYKALATMLSSLFYVKEFSEQVENEITEAALPGTHRAGSAPHQVQPTHNAARV